MSRGKKCIKNLANLSVSSFDNWQRQHGTWEKQISDLYIYQQLLELLLQLAQRKEEEAQQLPDISRPIRSSSARVWCRIWLAPRDPLWTVYDNLLHEPNWEGRVGYKNFLLFGEILDRNRPNSTKNCYNRVIYGFLRAVYDCYELFYESFTEKSNRGHLWEDFWHVKKLSLPSRILTSVCEMCRAIYGYQRVTYGCLRVTTSWQSVTTRKKNPCMWTRCYIQGCGLGVDFSVSRPSPDVGPTDVSSRSRAISTRMRCFVRAVRQCPIQTNLP